MSVTKKSAKRKITRVVGNISTYSLETSLRKLRDMFDELYRTYPEAWLDFGMHDSYSESYSFNIQIEVDETDEEYNKRIEQEELQKSKQIEWLKRNAEALGFNVTKKQEDAMIQNYEDELLGKLAEECAEVVQIICKINQWGMDSSDPFTKETNPQMLHQEIGDVLTMVDLLLEEGVLDDIMLQNAKLKKRVKFKKWSQFKPKPIVVPDY